VIRFYLTDAFLMIQVPNQCDQIFLRFPVINRYNPTDNVFAESPTLQWVPVVICLSVQMFKLPNIWIFQTAAKALPNLETCDFLPRFGRKVIMSGQAVFCPIHFYSNLRQSFIYVGTQVGTVPVPERGRSPVPVPEQGEFVPV